MATTSGPRASGDDPLGYGGTASEMAWAPRQRG